MSPTHLGMEMAYAAGGTLDQYQARSGAVQGGVRVLPEHEAVYFVAQLLSALAYCHSRRIVFRDVKPENCVLDVAKPPRLAICDFGVSRHFSKKAAVSMHTIAGTPGFLAPDVMAQMFVRGEKSGYDGRAADIWSSGAVLCACPAFWQPGSAGLLHTDATSSTGKLLTGHLPYAWDHELSETWDTNAAMHRVWAAARAAPMRDFLESPELCSPAAIEAMEAMMHFDGATRPCATACLLLPFFAEAQLPPPYVAAMARAAAEQAAREAEHAADPPRRLGGSKTSPGDWRDCKMRAFVARAVRPGPGEKVEHLALLGLAAGSMRSEVGSPRVSVDMTPERCLSPPARLMADAITQSPSRPASCAQLDEAEAPNST